MKRILLKTVRSVFIISVGIATPVLYHTEKENRKIGK